MSNKPKSTALYTSPFSKAYWLDAAAELKDTHMLVFAALMIALRLVLKQVAIPLTPFLKINTAFFVNALGAMAFGPVMAAICAVITDVLGYLLKPEGIYFVPFVLTEVAGSVVFALFLYRAKVTTTRVMLSRFTINFFINVALQTPIMMWYYALYMGGKQYTFAMAVPGIIKNVMMFPLESVLLTLFLCEGNETHKAEDGPVVLIAMHGDSTASSVADVVNSLAGCGNTYAYDMPLDKDMQQACDELKAMIQELDRGQGILLLYDMGSLRTMAEVISKETGVQIRTVAVPGTLIAVDCSRKAASASSLEGLHEDAMGSCRDFYTNIAEPEGRSHHKNTPVIITLCMTGEGGAVQMKNYLEKNAGLNGIQVIPLSISDRKALLNEVNRLREEHEIRCVIGTYDPGLHGIPFISVVKLFETSADKLDMLLTIPESDHTPVNYEMIFSYLSSQMPALDIKKLRKSLPRALAKIKRISAEGLDQNQELGLFLHIACAIDRLQNGEAMPEKGNRQGIISRNKRLYNDLREILSGLEETFDIRFSDDELAYMIAMVKKL